MDSDWHYSTVHNSVCKVIDKQTLWGQTVCRVWLPNQDAVARVPSSNLRPLSADVQPGIEAERHHVPQAARQIVPDIRALLLKQIRKAPG